MNNQNQFGANLNYSVDTNTEMWNAETDLLTDLTNEQFYSDLLRYQPLPTMISGFSKFNIGAALIDGAFSGNVY